MLKELIALSNELDKCGEKQAADIIDNLITKLAEGPEDEWEDIPTVVDPVAQGLEPLPPLAELQEERRKKMESKAPQKKEMPRVVENPADSASKLYSLLGLGDQDPSSWDEAKKEEVKKLLHQLGKSL